MIGKSIGRYRIVDQLGQGPMGTVYRAIDDERGRGVAIRQLNADLRSDDVLKRFRDESITLAELQQREIATVYDLVHTDGEVLLVTELVRGESLGQLSKRSGPLPAERAAYLTWQVLGGLARAHAAGLIHRDIKPSNVIVTDGGGIKIIDFGLSRIAVAERATDSALLRAPACLAPEQLLSQDIDSRADLYACGVVFYGLLTGMTPFKAANPAQLMQQQLYDNPVPASTYLPDVPQWCQAILDKALAKNPADRFQTAEEFRDALMKAIGSASGMTAADAGTAAVFAGSPTLVLPRHALPIPQAAPATPAPAAPKPATPRPVPPPVPIATPASTPAVQHAPVPPTAPMPVIAAPPPPPPVAAAPASRDSGSHRNWINALVVLAIGVGAVAVGMVAYNIRSAAARQAAQPAAAQPVTDAAASAPAAAVSTPTPPPAEAPAAPKTESTPTPTPKAAARETKVGTAPPAKSTPSTEPARETPPPTADAAPAARSAAAPAEFDGDAVVADGGRYRERNAKIQFGDGKLTIVQENGTVIASHPFETITGISYSTARHPMWNSPSGPAELLKVEGGAFGIRRGGRNWVAFTTSGAAQVVRVSDDDIRGVIAAVQAHLGRPVVRVVEKRD